MSIMRIIEPNILESVLGKKYRKMLHKKYQPDVFNLLILLPEYSFF